MNKNDSIIKIENFDFLIGKWEILNKRLKERLSNNNEWIEFNAVMETKPILNGMGLMDEMKTTHFGNDFVGLSIRLINPKTNIWTIYWADTFSPNNYLKEQVVGTFKNGIGEFYGIEHFNEKKYKLRFIWKKKSKNTAHWEQAYFDDLKGEWETNWIMLFSKIE